MGNSSTRDLPYIKVVNNRYSYTLNESMQLHSYDDRSAYIDIFLTEYWYKNGLLHRDNDLPAVICLDGSRYWFKNDMLHRDNYGPTYMDPSGKFYYIYEMHDLGYNRHSPIDNTDTKLIPTEISSTTEGI
jgi:hypothetical protein